MSTYKLLGKMQNSIKMKVVTQIFAFSIAAILTACDGQKISQDAPLEPQKTSQATSNLPDNFSVISAKTANTPVELLLLPNQNLPFGLGFSLYISGWKPNDLVDVYAYDEAKNQIEILAGEKALKISPEGKAAVSLPYNYRAFRPGRWLMVVKGASGTHAHYVEIPQ
ncbi:hypothetical protein VZF83_08120 [Synechococcus elongatus IITB3]|uniref:hypothetical protein n=2 Tax=Synechococcus elongatus TaxID=32046 RepID=UPI0030D378C9